MAQGILYDFYGALLTQHQQEVYEKVVYHDMSLQEIAEVEGISRQAVSDLIGRTTAQMERYEKALGMIRRFREIRGQLTVLREAAAQAPESALGQQALVVADKIEQQLMQA